MAAGVTPTIGHLSLETLHREGNDLSDSSACCKTSGFSSHETSVCEGGGLKSLTTAVCVCENHECVVGTNSVNTGMLTDQ